MNTYRYSLGRLTGVCPACGRRTFKFYVDNLSGRPLHRRCGRCNREVKCRYHLTPSSLGMANEPLPPSEAARFTATLPPPTPVAGNVMASCCLAPEQDPLFRHLASLAPAEAVSRAFSRCWTYHTPLLRGATLFALIDPADSFRSAKVMVYGPDGHRLKKQQRPTVGYLHSLLRLPGFVYESCYFCSHLAADYPGATLLMVESEKTALMLNMMIDLCGRWGSYVALATGGASMLRHDPAMESRPTYRTAVLRHRRVVLLPDADMVDRWRTDAESLRNVCSEVRLVDVRLPPYGLTGTSDIADYIETLLKNHDLLRNHD